MKMGVASERPQDLNVVPLSWKQGFPWLFVYRNCTASEFGTLFPSSYARESLSLPPIILASLLDPY